MSLYKKLYKDFEGLFLGYATLAIILNSCVGGAAAMVILMNGHDFGQMFQLFLAVSACMWYNTTILADMKPKFVFNSLLASLILCIFLLVLNIWMLMA
ncbi:MAG TPA: hypothetical protein VK010_02025 [Flavobacteriaceae bacterium]|nr:hypothetical protein [Flavobacteriaceae bacterium]